MYISGCTTSPKCRKTETRYGPISDSSSIVQKVVDLPKLSRSVSPVAVLSVAVYVHHMFPRVFAHTLPKIRTRIPVTPYIPCWIFRLHAR